MMDYPCRSHLFIREHLGLGNPRLCRRWLVNCEGMSSWLVNRTQRDGNCERTERTDAQRGEHSSECREASRSSSRVVMMQSTEDWKHCDLTLVSRFDGP